MIKAERVSQLVHGRSVDSGGVEAQIGPTRRLFGSNHPVPATLAAADSVAASDDANRVGA